MLNSAFASFRDLDPFARPNGLWFYNSLSRCYTFLPFYYGWGSPYGNSYSTAIFSPYFGYPTGGRTGGWPQGGNGNGNGSNGAGGSTSSGGYTHPSRPVNTPSQPSYGDGNGRRERM